MARGLICLLITQSLICKAFSSIALPAAVQQYLHLAAIPQTVTVPTQANTAPISSQVPANFANIANIATNYPTPVTNQVANSYANPIANQIANTILATYTNSQASSNCPSNVPRPPVSLPSLSPLALPNLVSGLPEARPIDRPNVSSIDSKLLNNLAIALQLLIVSNILNSPPPELQGKEDCDPQNVYPKIDGLPNSNFVGSSNYVEPNVMQGYSPSKTGMSLMSPYEALGPMSPYSDKAMPQFGNPRKDFRSPYSMIDTDLFPRDLF
ncbi:unnamed protein product [Chrysodeixis includens]|uniref:Uncharacterized protein n=1 Tax=Chrysodeixis includens TaxID=689277 RepID=A0A9N8Q0C1_CHRIL|nr:unnamed protein product [Chrysodeixis includens]